MDKAFKDMKAGKAPSPPGITAEILKISEGMRYSLVTFVVNQLVQGVIVPNNWCSSNC